MHIKLEKDSTHKSVLNHASNVCMTRDLNPWSFKTNGFPGLMVKNVYVKFSEINWIRFWDIVWKNRQTDKQTNGGENPSSWLALAWVMANTVYVAAHAYKMI